MQFFEYIRHKIRGSMTFPALESECNLLVIDHRKIEAVEE